MTGPNANTTPAMKTPDLSDSYSSAIATVGMAGRFPGARTIAEFWHNLSNGVESITPITDQELRAGGADPVELNDPSYVKAAAALDNIEMFDASFFGFSPKDVAIMDPQHRLLPRVRLGGFGGCRLECRCFSRAYRSFCRLGHELLSHL